MKNLIYAGFAIVAALTGCTMTEPTTPSQSTSKLSPEMKTQSSSDSASSDIRDYSRFSPNRHNKSLNEYAQQMVMQLQTTGELTGPIAVTSFVEFDDKLTRTNSLGNQLAEAFLIEMTRLGYPVADVNAAGAISVNADGSFAFSRKQKKKFRDLCCVLSGNLIYEANGVRVNSKLFNIQSKQILAASSLVIPYFVIEHLGGAEVR